MQLKVLQGKTIIRMKENDPEEMSADSICRWRCNTNWRWQQFQQKGREDTFQHNRITRAHSCIAKMQLKKKTRHGIDLWPAHLSLNGHLILYTDESDFYLLTKPISWGRALNANDIWRQKCINRAGTFCLSIRDRPLNYCKFPQTEWPVGKGFRSTP